MRNWNKLRASRSKHFWTEDRFIKPQRKDAPISRIKWAEGTVADFNLCSSKCRVFIGSIKTYNQWIDKTMVSSRRVRNKKKIQVRNWASLCYNNAIKEAYEFTHKIWNTTIHFPPPPLPHISSVMRHHAAHVYCRSLQPACLSTQNYWPMGSFSLFNNKSRCTK